MYLIEEHVYKYIKQEIRVERTQAYKVFSIGFCLFIICFLSLMFKIDHTSWSHKYIYYADLYCDKPSLKNGTVILPGKKNQIGSVAKYKCDHGYNILGPSSRQCLHHGEWSGFQPLCIRKQCYPIYS